MSSSPSSPNSPSMSEPLSPTDSNNSGHTAPLSHGRRLSIVNSPNSSPIMNNHNHIHLSSAAADLSSSRDTTTPTSIIDPGEEREGSSDDEYFKPIKRLRMIPNAILRPPSAPLQSPPPPPLPPPNVNGDSDKPLTSFLIKDILSHKPNHSYTNVSESRGIVRPWDIETNNHHNNVRNHNNNHIHHQHHINSFGRLAVNRRPRSADDDSRSERSESDSPESPASSSVAVTITSPLDALFEMTSKAFDGIDGSEKSSDASADHLNLFSNRTAQSKKKRKSRTAFTNHQIFELEKRFLYQKYLSPADRDEIAQSLGLTNAQVITWFQNRRAKLKRDMEELKKDVDAAKITGVHKSLLDNIQDLSLMKKSDLVAALHHQVKKLSQQQ